jgi:hypothetical protein
MEGRGRGKVKVSRRWSIRGTRREEKRREEKRGTHRLTSI